MKQSTAEFLKQEIDKIKSGANASYTASKNVVKVCEATQESVDNWRRVSEVMEVSGGEGQSPPAGVVTDLRNTLDAAAQSLQAAGAATTVISEADLLAQVSALESA